VLAACFFQVGGALQSAVRSPAAPVMGSLSASTITFAQVQQGFLLTVTGKELSRFCRDHHGTTLITAVKSSQQLQVTIPTDLISGPGTANVTVTRRVVTRVIGLQQRWNH